MSSSASAAFSMWRAAQKAEGSSDAEDNVNYMHEELLNGSSDQRLNGFELQSLDVKDDNYGYWRGRNSNSNSNASLGSNVAAQSALGRWPTTHAARTAATQLGLCSLVFSASLTRQTQR